MRRVAAIVAVLAGVMLIAFTFGEHLVSRSSDAEKISDHYQPLMSSAGPTSPVGCLGAGIILWASAVAALVRPA